MACSRMLMIFHLFMVLVNSSQSHCFVWKML